MNVFAITLPPGVGADATVSRESVPRGFGDSLDLAILSLDSPPTEGESKSPDVPLALIPDLALLGIASAPPPHSSASTDVSGNPGFSALSPALAPALTDVLGNPSSSTVPPTHLTMPVAGAVPAAMDRSNPALDKAIGITLESYTVPEGQRPPVPPDGVVVASIAVTRREAAVLPTTLTPQGQIAEHAVPGTEIAPPTAKSTPTPTPPVTARQDLNRAAVEEAPTTQPTSPSDSSMPIVVVEGESTTPERGEADEEPTSDKRSSGSSEVVNAQSAGRSERDSVVERPERHTQTGVRDALRAMSARISHAPEVKVAGDVHIVLDSMDWGAVHASVSVEEGRVETQVQVRDERLAMVMQAHRHELFDRIEAKGLSMDSFQVSRDNPRQGGGHSHPQYGSPSTASRMEAGEPSTPQDSLASATWSPTSRWINTTA